MPMNVTGVSPAFWMNVNGPRRVSSTFSGSGCAPSITPSQTFA